MQLYESKQKFKYVFLVTAIVIAVASVLITNVLVSNLASEERKKIETWAEAVRLISLVDSISDANLFFLSSITESNTTIPLLLVDEDDNVLHDMNIKIPEQGRDLFLQKTLQRFKKVHEPIVIESDEIGRQYVYYDDSSVLKHLQIFPYAQLGVVSIFIIVSFLALSSSKKAEQNRVWVGLSKETAHQLGTPISSLMAWVEYLKTKAIDPKLLNEIDKDVQRLKMIAERFSKIGSNVVPEPMDLNIAIHNAIDYMSKRVSSKVQFKCNFPDESVLVLMNESLFGWVIENLIKNAVDAMDGKGLITFDIHTSDKKIIKLDISDTGKGIPKSKFNAVFQPGYTTKSRGWGLGLSLVRRIIESYHHGKIQVFRSEPNVGTTFRIELKKYS